MNDMRASSHTVLDIPPNIIQPYMCLKRTQHSNDLDVLIQSSNQPKTQTQLPDESSVPSHDTRTECSATRQCMNSKLN